MLIQFQEPENCRYIHVKDGIMHLFIPLVGGGRIGTDNTCKSTLSLKEFFGKNAGHQKSALDELENYRTALINDIDNIQKNLPDRKNILEGKKDRLIQVERYIRAFKAMAESKEIIKLSNTYPHYPESIITLLNPQKKGRKCNLYSMLLNPGKLDPATRFNYPIFSVNRQFDTHLYNSLNKKFANINFAASKTPGQATTSFRQKCINEVITLLGGEETKFDFEQSLAILTSTTKKYYKQDVDFTIDSSAKKISREYLEDITADSNMSLRGYLETWFSCAANRLMDPTPPFALLASKDAKVARQELNIMVQFFLAEVNIFARSQALTTYNFGQVLEGIPQTQLANAHQMQSYENKSTQLRKALCERIVQKVEGGERVDHEIINFINDHAQDFGLNKTINPEERDLICSDFQQDWSSIEESPHFDEFIILDNRSGQFVNHQGAIAVDFVDVFEKNLGYHQTKITPEDKLFFKAVSQSSEKLTGEVNSLNDSIVDYYEIDNFEEHLLRLLASEETHQQLADLFLSKSMVQIAADQKKEGRVFENITAATLNKLKNSPKWNRFVSKIASQMPNKAILDSFNNKVMAELEQVNISYEQARTLYTAVVHRIGPQKVSGFATASEMLEILQALGINKPVNEPIVANSQGGFHLSLKAYANKELDKILKEYTNQIYITPPMAANLYLQVAERFGKDSPEFHTMQNLNNFAYPFPKMTKTLALLGIQYEKIDYPKTGKDGYILTVSADNLQLLENIQQYQTTFALSPEVAKFLYIAVGKLGFAEEIANLDNIEAPNKIKRSLELLQITHGDIDFQGDNAGYVVHVSPWTIERLRAIVHAAQSATEKSADAAALIQKPVVAPGNVNQLKVKVTTTRTAKPATPQLSLPISSENTPVPQETPAPLTSSTPREQEDLQPAPMRTPAFTRQAPRASTAAAPSVPTRFTLPLRSRPAIASHMAANPQTIVPNEYDLVIEKVAAFRAAILPGIAAAVRLNCPKTILTAFHNLVRNTSLMNCSFKNPYTGIVEYLPAKAEDFTARHLQILARNEYANDDGVMKEGLYKDKLSSNQIATLRCLVKMTNVCGYVPVHGYGGYGENNPEVRLSQSHDMFIVDQAGLQWQGDYRNTGGLFFYPEPDPKLPAGYFEWQADTFRSMFNEERPAAPSANSITINWNGVSGKLDLDWVANAIACEFTQAWNALTTQSICKSGINFKYVKAGMGFFSEGVDDKQSLEGARLKGILQALQHIAQLPARERLKEIGNIKRLELPFSGIYEEHKPLLAQIEATVKSLGLVWGGTPTTDALFPVEGYINACNNTGDPHAMAGNEGVRPNLMRRKVTSPKFIHPSLDASISIHADVDILNAAYNTRMIVCEESALIVPKTQADVATTNMAKTPTLPSGLFFSATAQRADDEECLKNVIAAVIHSGARNIHTTGWCVFNAEKDLEIGIGETSQIHSMATTNHQIMLFPAGDTVAERVGIYDKKKPRVNGMMPEVNNDEVLPVLLDVLARVGEENIIEFYIYHQLKKIITAQIVEPETEKNLQDTLTHVGVSNNFPGGYKASCYNKQFVIETPDACIGLDQNQGLVVLCPYTAMHLDEKIRTKEIEKMAKYFPELMVVNKFLHKERQQQTVADNALGKQI